MLPSLYHWFPVADEEVKSTLPPAQKVVGVVVLMVGVAGIAFTVTVVAADAKLGQPLVVTITV